MNPPYTTVLSAAEVAAHLDDPEWVIVDCRFDLLDTAAGERRYRQGHIPGAVYAHLDRDLSGAKTATGEGGRHPLPAPAELTRTFGGWGIGPGVQVVAYDDQSGHYAARLWWLLRFMGHQAVAVLDGGWPAWTAAGLPVVASGEAGDRAPTPRLFEGGPRFDRPAAAAEAEAAARLVDGRAPERYRGEVEPLDPVAGHIPGAANRPYVANWDAGGRWRAPEALLAEFLELLGDTPAEDAVFYCGSGVSACVNLLAMVRAGLPEGRLYVGSWSEWSRLGRPVARGAALGAALGAEPPQAGL
ncbi:MAG: sulfurtransferase [Candidatus Promineofilum sp.]|nr:sulfurtransferase [Promineifilum sp.]